MPYTILPRSANRLQRAWVGPMVLLLALGCSEDAETPLAPEAPAAAVTATQVLEFRQVSGGNDHTCGVTTAGKAYCWGRNFSGELGNGSTDNSSVPVPVAGGLTFRQVSAGGDHTCAITTANVAYCWGAGGILGDGSTTRSLTPVRVKGQLRFRQLDAGVSRTCAVSDPDRRAYCWGNNTFGSLGDGSTVVSRLVPTPVAGGLRFRQVSTGFLHGCGVTTADKAFCWGSDRFGQIGNGADLTNTNVPKTVAGTRLFRQVDTGWDHTCAITPAGKAFCWGEGSTGQVGDGKRLDRFTPKAVAGDFVFDRVTTGNFHTCGETPENRVRCWGNNVLGQLGDGTTTSRLVSVQLTGVLRFTQVNGGGFHTCGVSSGAAYCWGDNQFGTVGNGSTGGFSTDPTPVAGPS
jgi:alpha-tubulin suppressor-like RCC1 family protein